MATTELTLSDLDYRLPPALIAQQPARQRDASRLLVLARSSGQLDDASFRDLPQLLSPGDLLVTNDTRVIPAKFTARRATGGRIEGLFLREPSPGAWEVLLRNVAKLKAGETLVFDKGLEGEGLQLVDHLGQGRCTVRLLSDEPTMAVLDRIGATPLPPYIHRNGDGNVERRDRERYQTVFAEKPGAVAAPTAALHFTPEVLAALAQRRIDCASVTLHVGPGTFAPVTTDSLADHQMHAEWFELPASTADAVRRCRAHGGRVVAVGTTSVRVLETCACSGALVAGSGWTNLFIAPPFAFEMTDVLMTNFHLPRSTLLALVMAFAGVEPTRRAYAHAVAGRYRFYSYGDAMLIV